MPIKDLHFLLEHSLIKAEENIICANRDKFRLDGKIEAANLEDSLSGNKRSLQMRAKAKHEIARLNAKKTIAGSIRPDSLPLS